MQAILLQRLIAMCPAGDPLRCQRLLSGDVTPATKADEYSNRRKGRSPAQPDVGRPCKPPQITRSKASGSGGLPIGLLRRSGGSGQAAVLSSPAGWPADAFPVHCARVV